MTEDFWSPVLLSLEVSLLAAGIVFALALAAAWGLRGRRFPGKTLLETLFMLPLVLPPTVVGFGLLLLLGRKSWIGRSIEWLFHQPLVFSFGAAVAAAVVVAFPLAYLTLKTGFAGVEPELEEAARSMGAHERQVLLYVTLPLAWRAMVTAGILGFARSMGEFGATLMVAGNIPGKTQTVPTAIYLAVETGDMEQALAWSLTVVLFSFLLLGLSQRIRLH